MPRRNPTREIRGEEFLALRIRQERETRGWSPERLAKEMTSAGVPLQTSAIYRIEGGSPRRKISVDEALGFARVFAMPLDDLLVDPDAGAEGHFNLLHARLLEIRGRREDHKDEMRLRSAQDARVEAQLNEEEARIRDQMEQLARLDGNPDWRVFLDRLFSEGGGG